VTRHITNAELRNAQAAPIVIVPGTAGLLTIPWLLVMTSTLSAAGDSYGAFGLGYPTANEMLLVMDRYFINNNQGRVGWNGQIWSDFTWSLLPDQGPGMDLCLYFRSDATPPTEGDIEFDLTLTYIEVPAP
jgi:hypothetical protein